MNNMTDNNINSVDIFSEQYSEFEFESLGPHNHFNNSGFPNRKINSKVLYKNSSLSAYATSKFEEARQLFSIGMEVDPYHGPLYHAYGNSELVSYL